MTLLRTQIEISAPPHIVREKFLRFNLIQSYSPQGFIRSINAASPEKSPKDLVKGDLLNVVVGGGTMKFSPSVKENSSSEFTWSGGLRWLFLGSHSFRFEPVASMTSEHGEQTTLFVHEELFQGILSWLMGESWLAGRIAFLGGREATRRGFQSFNGDFKAWVEGSK